MTSNVNLTSSAVAEAYDFGQWESLMDVGGGHGILLSRMLHHTSLRGVLADQPDVLERARVREFLDGKWHYALQCRTAISFVMFRPAVEHT